MAAYYLKGVAPDWKRSDVYWGMAQSRVLQVIGLILCIAFPEIILWFPRWLFDRP
jgi:TRAP-type mannitol/chloroaromatic compound transport system permease large subunit